MQFLLTLFTWAFIGPLGMLVMLVKIAEQGDGWATGHDVTFFVLMFAAVGARWIDYRCGDPITGQGKGAKPGGAGRYTLLIVPLGLALWIAANLIGNRGIG
jgi:hypothetical protein